MGDWLSQFVPLGTEKLVLGILSLFPATMLGRVLYRHQMVLDGRRDAVFTWDFWWEVPTALLCAILAGGLAEYMNAGSMLSHAIAGTVGWFGPKGLQWFMIKLVEKYTSTRPEKDTV